MTISIPAHYRSFQRSFSTDERLILPGYGALSIALGDAERDVVSKLGEPDEIYRTVGTPLDYWYYKRGASFEFDKQEKVRSIRLYAHHREVWVDFEGRTPEGISARSDMDDVEQAYGEPDYRDDMSGLIALRYSHMGLQVIFNQSPLVTHLLIRQFVD